MMPDKAVEQTAGARTLTAASDRVSAELHAASRRALGSFADASCVCPGCGQVPLSDSETRRLALTLPQTLLQRADHLIE